MNPSILMKDFKSESFRTLSKALSFRNLSVIPMHWSKVPSSPGTKQIWEGCELDFSFSSPLLNLFGYFIHVYLYINAFQYYLPPTFSSPSFWLGSPISPLFLHLRLLPISHFNAYWNVDSSCWLDLMQVTLVHVHNNHIISIRQHSIEILYIFRLHFFCPWASEGSRGPM